MGVPTKWTSTRCCSVGQVVNHCLSFSYLTTVCCCLPICSNTSCFALGTDVRVIRNIVFLLAMALLTLLSPPCAEVRLNPGHYRNKTLTCGGKQPQQSHCCEQQNVIQRDNAGQKDCCVHVCSVLDSALSQVRPRSPLSSKLIIALCLCLGV